MIINRINFLRCVMLAFAVCAGTTVHAAQAPNPRGSSASQQNLRSNDSGNVSRVATSRALSRTSGMPVSARGAVVSNAARGGATVARSAITGATVRGKNARSATTARTATTPVSSRASMARATAVFNDISKIGGGYAACREAYATCMDQFCANANDTYRRCYCSSRFTEFRNTEDAMDQAKTLLMQFEDNNLNAVDKTAAEVNAMYSATVGEAAIKKDTSAAAKVLDEIGDLLSGKKSTSNTSSLSSTSLGIIPLEFNGDLDDVWSNGGNSIFTTGGGQNLSELEGVSLYNAANNQCMNMIVDSCSNNAVANMARSSYSILITQDCNAYQKSLDKKLESVKQTVRTAEKYLREARLEEYRSHNSADVNECIAKVRTAIQNDSACGANYKRCLDFTGAYINQAGEWIPSPRFFKLADLIKLDGVDADVVKQNPDYDKNLEGMRIHARAALDTCRDIQNLVWDEFKRTAIIEIAQAQDEKIEEVKMSCVSTMADCYDTQTSALKNFDNTTAQMAGALSAYAARHMCADRVMACASLYGNTDGCTFDGNGKLTAGNKTSDDGISRCGLGALLNFVDTVDDIRIAEGCETALKNYAQTLCTDTVTGHGYPWNCRLKSTEEIKKNIDQMSNTYCNLGGNTDYNIEGIDDMIQGIVDDITLDISYTMADVCERTSNGVWVSADDYDPAANIEYEPDFYRTVYGTTGPKKIEKDKQITEYGVCKRNNIKVRCELEDERSGGHGYAKYNATTETCLFTTEYYQYQCNWVGGEWRNNRCYVERN